jgi:Tfp pilus assembly protein PilX
MIGVLRSAKGRAAALVVLMVLLLVSMTVVGIFRTRDHQSRLEGLQQTSLAAAAMEQARGEFLHATTSLAALTFLQDPSYFSDYESSFAIARGNISQARDAALSSGSRITAAGFDDLARRMDTFDEGVASVVAEYLFGDQQAAMGRQPRQWRFQGLSGLNR